MGPRVDLLGYPASNLNGGQLHQDQWLPIRDELLVFEVVICYAAGACMFQC
jgi:hypothetical protein